MGLHTEQYLIIPIGRPLALIGAVQHHWQKGGYDDQSIGRVQMDGLNGGGILGPMIGRGGRSKAHGFFASRCSARTTHSTQGRATSHIRSHASRSSNTGKAGGFSITSRSRVHGGDRWSSFVLAGSVAASSRPTVVINARRTGHLSQDIVDHICLAIG